MSFARYHDINSYIGAVSASDSATATAAGTGDNTLVTGLVIDRFALGLPLSAAFVLRYKTALAAAATLSFAWSVETSSDSGFSTPVVLASQTSTVQETGAAGGSTNRGVLRIPVDLGPALQYVRLKFTPDLSASGTDTFEGSAVAVLGGQENLPA